MELQSWRDGLLVGIPMFLVLLAYVFRLDEGFASRPALMARRPLAGGVDRNGMPICLDPEGKPYGRMLTNYEMERRGRGRPTLELR